MSYVALANTTLSSAVTTVTFSNIPTTGYRDLVMVVRAACSQNSNNVFRVNSDGGSNYNGRFMTGAGSTPTAGGSGGTWVALDSSAFTTTVIGETTHIFHILDYATTNKHKPFISSASRATAALDSMYHKWSSDSAITSIQFFSASASFITFTAGSTFALYGITA
jgi:hypothetical protein